MPGAEVATSAAGPWLLAPGLVNTGGARVPSWLPVIGGLPVSTVVDVVHVAIGVVALFALTVVITYEWFTMDLVPRRGRDVCRKAESPPFPSLDPPEAGWDARTIRSDDGGVNTRVIVSTVTACLLAAVSALVLPGREAASWEETFSPHLLEPGGAADIGVRRARLETGADDPWRPGHERVVMVDIHYPAAADDHPLRHYARAQYMTELGMLAWAPDHERTLGLHEGEVNWMFRTHAREWAPPRRGTYPVVVISAPDRGLRTSYTALAEDLASHGIVVVTVDHPYDAPAVELWPTRTVVEADDAELELTGTAAGAARAADVESVAARAGGLDPGVGQTTSGCVVVVSGALQALAAALTDDPMVEAQISSRFPGVSVAPGPRTSLATAERDFRTRSAAFRSALAARLDGDPACRPGSDSS